MMNMYNPYIMQQPQQDIGGLSPVFQNISAQQANQNMAIQQGQQMANQAAQSGQQSGGMNPMAMAAMLRKKDPKKPAPVTDYSQPMPNYLDPAYQDAGY